MIRYIFPHKTTCWERLPVIGITVYTQYGSSYELPSNSEGTKGEASLKECWKIHVGSNKIIESKAVG